MLDSNGRTDEKETAMTKKAEVEAAKNVARTRLLEILKPGDTVYCIIRHVSASGMQREISLYVKAEDGMVWLDGYVSTLMGTRRGKRDGLVVSGCGMDMGFALVYELSHALFPEGFAVEGRGRNGDTSGWDKNGGYALKHSWL
jgi:hypothetical protein